MTRPRGAGGFDLNSMMKQVQQMQAEMVEAQEKLKDEVVEASAGGGMVKAKMSGDLRLLELTIDPEAIDPEDVELLQDMVLAAVNEAIRSAQELAARSSAASPDGLGAGGAGSAGPAGRCRPPGASISAACSAADQPAGHRARELPGIGQRTRSGSPSTSCAPRTTRRSRSPTRSARSRRRSACARSASTSPRARAAGSARTSGATGR